jgi:hypothetical protein
LAPRTFSGYSAIRSGASFSIWYERGDPGLLEVIRAVRNFAQRTVQPRFPPGAHRFGSVENASEQRRPWERRDIEAMQRQMKPSV